MYRMPYYNQFKLAYQVALTMQIYQPCINLDLIIIHHTVCFLRSDRKYTEN